MRVLVVLWRPADKCRAFLASNSALAAAAALWALVPHHQSELKTISFSEKVYVFAEFFRGHPNACPLVSEFVAVKLDDAQVASQLHRIRMSSYHWEAVAGIGAEQEYAIPANYEWFLRLIKKRCLGGSTS